MRTLSTCLLCLCVSFSTSAGAQANAPARPVSPPSPGGGAGGPAGAAPGTPAPSNPPAGGAYAPGGSAPATAPSASPNPAAGAMLNASGNNASGIPDVNDPMLTPVETPGQVLSNWQQALVLVRTRSTSVATAQSRVAEAQARSRQALSSVLPNITANGAVRRSLLFGTDPQLGRVPASSTIWTAGVSLRQSLVDLRSWHDVGTSKSVVEAAAVSAEDAERLALGALADTIVTVITAERLAEVSRVSLRSNLSTLDLTKKRTLLGAASAVDVLRAEQEVASNRLDVVQADESLRQSREALGMALGFPEAWGVAADIKVDQLATDARSVCSPIQDPEQRSDVRAARLNVVVSERTTESTSYGLAPTLQLGSDFNYNSVTNPRPVDWSISALLTVPIYDGGLLGAERGVNQATAEVARQQLTQTARQAHLEASQAQRSVRVAQANFDVSRQARDIAAESARLSRIAFVHGTGTSFDLVESARRQRLAEIDVTIKEFEVVRAQITALLALSNCNI
jgi:multidrug efflux system outer membrane protein